MFTMYHISNIDELATGLLRDVVGHFEGLHRCPVKICHLVVRVEPRVMHRDLGRKAVDDPVRELFYLFFSVVEAWNDQIGELEVYA